MARLLLLFLLLLLEVNAPLSAQTTRKPIEFFGFLQPQFETTAAPDANRFFFRRVRLGVQGWLGSEVFYQIHGNADDRTNPLRNAFVEYHGWSKDTNAPILRFGQFKLPYTIEALKDNAFIVPMIERAIAVEQLAFNHDRDLGLALYTKNDPKRPYEYFLSVFSGSGRNQFRSFRPDHFAGRVQWNTTPRNPFLGGSLALGFSMRQGSVLNRLRAPGRQQEDERYAFDLEFRNRLWRFRGEYLWGRDATRELEGYYLLADYRVSKPLELLARYEGYSPGATLPAVNRTTLGVTYSFSRTTQLQVNYEWIAGQAPSGQTNGIRLRVQTLFP